MKIGIIGAMAVEVQMLKDIVKNNTPQEFEKALRKAKEYVEK